MRWILIRTEDINLVKIEIKKATKKHILQLSKLFRQEIEYQQRLSGYFELQQDFDWEAYVGWKLGGSNRQVFVAVSGECLAGFIDIKIINYPSSIGFKSILKRILHPAKKGILLPIKPIRWGFIEDCYVVPSLRKQGIGSQLVVSATKWFQSKNVGRIELSLVAKNTEGEAFWRKAGYETFRLSLSRDI